MVNSSPRDPATTITACQLQPLQTPTGMNLPNAGLIPADQRDTDQRQSCYNDTCQGPQTGWTDTRSGCQHWSKVSNAIPMPPWRLINSISNPSWLDLAFSLSIPRPNLHRRSTSKHKLQVFTQCSWRRQQLWHLLPSSTLGSTSTTPISYLIVNSLSNS